MQKTAAMSKILKTVQSDLTFIFDVLSESRIVFVALLVFLALENVVNITKILFLSKTRQCIYA